MRGAVSERFDVAIAGGGHGGAQTAIALRQAGFGGSIGLFDADSHPPYHRPPLSKEYLAGERPFERILIRPVQFWAEREISLRLGRRVSAVDPAAQELVLEDGARVGYVRLVWAAGGAPRPFPGADAAWTGLHEIRNRSDVDRLIGELPSADRILIIGGGYIGLEAAAVMRKLGKTVVLLEALPRVLARVAGEALSRFYEAEHRAQGVDLRLGVRIGRITARDGRVTGVELEDATALGADVVIAGIGIVPNVAALKAAGAACSNGVEVDDYCATSLPDVFAVGDCAAHRNPFAGGELIRLECVQNAADQAAAVAKTICGEPTPYHAVPWFWSNQYDLKLQTVGISAGHDDVVVRGDIGSRSFSLVYLKSGRVIALDCVNAVRDYVQGRALVAAGASPQREQIADSDVALKDLVALEHA